MTLPLFFGASLIGFWPTAVFIIFGRVETFSAHNYCTLQQATMMAFIFSSVVWAVVKPLQSVYAYVMAMSGDFSNYL